MERPSGTTFECNGVIAVVERNTPLPHPSKYSTEYELVTVFVRLRRMYRNFK